MTKAWDCMRLGYGAGDRRCWLGALVTVWLSVLAIRFLGTVAQAEVNMAKTPAAARQGDDGESHGGGAGAVQAIA